MFSSESPVVKKSAGDKNSFVSVGFSVTRAGSSAFNGIVSRSADETMTGMVTLRAATSAILVAWGTSSGDLMVVAELSSDALDTVFVLGLACGKANATLKSIAEIIGPFMLEDSRQVAIGAERFRGGNVFEDATTSW
jgi:hypothetical protein